MLSGQLIGLAGVALFAGLVRDATGWPLVLALAALFSIGQGVVFTTMYATATTGTAEADQGTASGIATTGQQLGGAIGLAVLINVVTVSGGVPLTVAMTGIAVIIGIATLVALTIPGRTPTAAASVTPQRQPEPCAGRSQTG
ncbi:MFS transporter [Enemella evansiae]|uniref:MFS transporter n=1 Tax=Enemella evansiae TaxID=2016499 RepID=UPI0026B8D998